MLVMRRPANRLRSCRTGMWSVRARYVRQGLVVHRLARILSKVRRCGECHGSMLSCSLCGTIPHWLGFVARLIARVRRCRHGLGRHLLRMRCMPGGLLMCNVRHVIHRHHSVLSIAVIRLRARGNVRVRRMRSFLNFGSRYRFPEFVVRGLVARSVVHIVRRVTSMSPSVVDRGTTRIRN